MPLTLAIVTPEGPVFEETVDTVTLPTVNGEVGILPGHIPLLTQLEAGTLHFTQGTRNMMLVCGRGFAEVAGDKVSVLAEHAITEEQINPDAVEEAQRRAEEALRDAERLDPAEVEQLEGVVRFAVAQLALKRRPH